MGMPNPSVPVGSNPAVRRSVEDPASTPAGPSELYAATPQSRPTVGVITGSRVQSGMQVVRPAFIIGGNMGVAVFVIVWVLGIGIISYIPMRDYTK